MASAVLAERLAVVLELPLAPAALQPESRPRALLEMLQRETEQAVLRQTPEARWRRTVRQQQEPEAAVEAP